MTTPVIGIDVSKQILDIVIVSNHPKSVPYFQVKNSPAGMRDLLKRLDQAQVADCRVCMEATGRLYERVALTLHQAGFAVSVVNPAQIKAYGQSQLRRNKTDKLDARLVADFAQTHHLPVWQPLSQPQSDLQQLVRYREAMVNHRQQQRNRRAALPTGSCLIDFITQQLADLTAHLKHLERQIRLHIRLHADLHHTFNLLKSIVGLGERVFEN